MINLKVTENIILYFSSLTSFKVIVKKMISAYIPFVETLYNATEETSYQWEIVSALLCVRSFEAC